MDSTAALQLLMEFTDGGVRRFLNQCLELLQVDLHHPQTAHGPGSHLAILPPSLFDAPDPGAAHGKEFGNLLAGHSAVVCRQHAVPQVLPIGCSHLLAHRIDSCLIAEP